MMKKVILYLVVLTSIFVACQKADIVRPEGMTYVELSFKNSASVWDNILQKNMVGVFQGTAANYSPEYPFLWIINGDTTESNELTRQLSFSENGNYDITLVVFDAEGNPSSSSISIEVIDQYIFPQEFKLISSGQLPNGKYLYNIWVNLDYLPGTHEKYYWFVKNEETWQINEIHNFHLDADSVTWGSFSAHTQFVWTKHII